MTVGRRSRSFTLIELLVVMVIIGLLAGLLFPVLVAAKQKSRITKTKGEVRELAKAWGSYWDTYQINHGSFSMDDTKVGILLGLDTGANSNSIKFMDFPLSVQTSGFFDPWKKQLYKVEFPRQSITRWQEMNTRVYLGNRERYVYGY